MLAWQAYHTVLPYFISRMRYIILIPFVSYIINLDKSYKEQDKNEKQNYPSNGGGYTDKRHLRIQLSVLDGGVAARASLAYFADTIYGCICGAESAMAFRYPKA